MNENVGDRKTEARKVILKKTNLLIFEKIKNKKKYCLSIDTVQNENLKKNIAGILGRSK